MNFQESADRKTKFIDINHELQVSGISHSMKDTESAGSRAENTILAELNYVPRSYETMKKLALALHTLLSTSS